jgi:hypothetical protein
MSDPEHNPDTIKPSVAELRRLDGWDFRQNVSGSDPDFIYETSVIVKHMRTAYGDENVCVIPRAFGDHGNPLSDECAIYVRQDIC